MASRVQSARDTGLWRETVKSGAVRGGTLVTAGVLFIATLLMALALASYRASDPALNTAAGDSILNLVGEPGAWFADIALSLFGPVAALLAEMFPPAIRYSSLSIPYHLGTGYFGGFLPFISQYIVAKTGDPFAGLWYTMAVVLMALVVTMIGLREDRRGRAMP